MEPLPRGSDFEFVDEIFGGSIPQQFRPRREGIQETRSGATWPVPVVDFGVTLLDGSSTPSIRTSSRSRWPAAIAFQGRDDALQAHDPRAHHERRSIRAEPTSRATSWATSTDGAAAVAGMEQRASMTVVKAQVPMSEMLTYEQTLTATTGARWHYKMEFSHYEEVPTHLQTKIIAAAKAAKRRGRRGRGRVGTSTAAGQARSCAHSAR